MIQLQGEQKNYNEKSKQLYDRNIEFSIKFERLSKELKYIKSQIQDI